MSLTTYHLDAITQYSTNINPCSLAVVLRSTECMTTGRCFNSAQEVHAVGDRACCGLSV